MPESSKPRTLSERIEAERGLEDGSPRHASHCICDRCLSSDARIRAARAATDEAVRDLTRWAHELIATADAMADRLALPQAVQDELDSITLAIARVLPAPTTQGESTGGDHVSA